MSRDSTFHHLHLHASSHADLLESFTSSHSKLPAETIDVAPEHQPLSPEDEDDVVPDQHAAFGIQRAREGRRDRTVWRDWGLDGFLAGGPPLNGGGVIPGLQGAGGSTVGAGGGMGQAGPGAQSQSQSQTQGRGSSMPR